MSRVITAYAVAALLSGLFAGCSASSADRVSMHTEWPLIEGPGRWSFAELGWTEDAVLMSDRDSAKVIFRLPDGVVQGDPLWYGVHLAYEWTGKPGFAPTGGAGGDFSHLIGTWNGHGFYLLELEPVSDLGGGYEWFMADLINGGSKGYESSPTFAAASTSFAIYKAIEPGINDVTIYPSLFDATNKNVRLVVKKESEIIATSWKRSDFAAEAEATLEYETIHVKPRGANEGVVAPLDRLKAIHIRVEGQNQGWGAPGLEVRATVNRSDGSRRIHSWNLGPLEPLGSVKFERTITNEHESPVVSVVVELDWGGGRRGYVAWPKEPGPPWYTMSVFRSSIGAMIALVVVWVGVPMLYQAWRDSRKPKPPWA